MDSADWASLTGSSFVGMGPIRRPPNPKLLAQLIGKTAPPARRRSNSSSSGAAHRRLMLSIYKLTTPSAAPSYVPAQYRTRAGRLAAFQRILRQTAASERRAARSGPIRDATIMEQSQIGYAGIEAQNRHMMAARAAMRSAPPPPSSRPKPPPKWGMNYWP